MGGTYRGGSQQQADGVVDISADIQRITGEAPPPMALTEEELREIKRRKPRLPFVESMWFNGCIGFVIVVNMFFIGIEMDFRTRMPEGLSPMEKIEHRLGWYIMEFIFCTVFFIELVLRLYSLRWRYFSDVMNVMDFFLVVLAVVDTWILSMIGMDGIGGTLAAFRVVRMLRLVRFVRLLRMFKELWLIVSGLVNSMKTLAWVGLLIAALVYVGAIFLTEQVGKRADLYGDLAWPTVDSPRWPVEVYFGGVLRSMLTLFQVLTLDSWADEIARPVMAKQPEMGLFFCLFILLGTFGVLNIVVGVIVENTLGTANSTEKQLQREKEMQQKHVLDSLKKLFEASDTDNSGTLTKAEVQAAVQMPEVEEKFRHMGIAMDEVYQLFDLMDPTGKGVLSLDDFVSACLQFVGGSQKKDLMQLSMHVESLGRRMQAMESIILGLEKDTRATKQMTIRFMKETLPHLAGGTYDPDG